MRHHGPCHPASLPTRLISRGMIALDAPARLREIHRVRRFIATHPPENAPVIIVGHWRSGTTHLHNLLHRTGCFPVLRHVDAIRPWARNPVDGWLARRLKAADRGLDAIPLHAETPQEDEIALAAMTPLSTFLFTAFPRDPESIFRRGALLEGVTREELDEFEAALRFLLAKIRLNSTATGPILLKNPGHTARLGFLRTRFPQARFIHIVRDPVAVVLSTRRFVDKLIRPLSLQGPPGPEFEEAIADRYRRMMLAHLEQRQGLPEGTYHELRYEDLIRGPEAAVSRIFGFLGLEFPGPARDRLKAYLEGISGFRTNRHADPPGLRDQLRQECAFAFEQWGYD